MLASNHTTLFEHWSNLVELYSFNHAWLGSVGAWFRRFQGGISHADDAVGFDHVLIQPFPPAFGSAVESSQQPGQPPAAPVQWTPGSPLPWSAASYASVRGRVSSSWSYAVTTTDAAINVTVSLPANVRTTVMVPYPCPGGGSVTGASACAPAGPPTPVAGGYRFELSGVAGTCTFILQQALSACPSAALGATTA